MQRHFAIKLVSLMSVLLFACGTPVCGQQPQGDIAGGAAFLLQARPANPKSRGRAVKSAVAPSETATNSNKTVAKADELEDALALGNSLRDRNPPDLESAEQAYRLAIKLWPRDPRPYTGLGNVLYDQKRYAEAAETYREALRLSAPRSGIGGLIGGIQSGGLMAGPSAGGRELKMNLVLILIQQNDFAAAESELRNATKPDSTDPSWMAALGSVLYLQGQFQEAADYFEQAHKMDPRNEKYDELRNESLARSKSASLRDEEMSKALTQTEWRVSTLQNGVCRLEAEGALRCDNSGRAFHQQMSWRIKEGLLDLFTRSGPTTADRCTGAKQTNQIRVKCFMGNELVQEIWTPKTN